MELWGGIECTINRVGDRWRDQCELTGHAGRFDDIDKLAGLGLTAIRYPALWEHVSPDDPELRDWSWLDPRLARLREQGVRVIAGLVHHGSGPCYTDLLAAGFAPGLARHARAVAERFEWIEDWTPVNEPVTTARFSALYGLWHPHVRDEGAFWLALLNQIDGVRLAMREVRAVNPAARLIQTDDLGRTYATAPLRNQAGFDNVRRWVGWDLLVGTVTSAHPLFARIAGFGLGDRLRAIADDPCPPNVIGVNHYLTSDRFLDHRVDRYPHLPVGGNGHDRYVDIEAIRVVDPAPQGFEGALREAWQRYRIPLAATEVHNGCTREEQLRWMARAWDTASDLQAEGIDLRAVTSWALLGSSGWNTLLTRPGAYEAGAFDVSGGSPRSTALVNLLRNLPTDGSRPPATEGLGWWERPIRLLHEPVPRAADERVAPPRLASRAAAQPILICGASGTLGRAVARACRHRDLSFVLTGRAELALDNKDSITQALERHRPWAVINAAGWVRVDEAENHEKACLLANGAGAADLARLCEERGIGSVAFSSDLVFDGAKAQAYDEHDLTGPLSTYGRSKLAAEEAIASLPGGHLVVRTAAFFSPFDPHNFAWAVVETLRCGVRFEAICDEVVSPTYVPDLANVVLDLAIDQAQGLWHLTNETALSWSEFAVAIARAVGLDASLIDPVPAVSACGRAVRPRMSALKSVRGKLLGSFDDACVAFAIAMTSQKTRLAA